MYGIWLMYMLLSQSSISKVVAFSLACSITNPFTHSPFAAFSVGSESLNVNLISYLSTKVFVCRA